MIYVISGQLALTTKDITPTKIDGRPKLSLDMPTEPNWGRTKLPLPIEISEATDEVEQLL
jgi:hypothetical protein